MCGNTQVEYAEVQVLGSSSGCSIYLLYRLTKFTFVINNNCASKRLCRKGKSLNGLLTYIALEKKEQKRLNLATLFDGRVKSLTQCIGLCGANSGCQSINFGRNYKNGYACQLLAFNLFESGYYLQRNYLWDHYYIPVSVFLLHTHMTKSTTITVKEFIAT